MKTQNRKPTAQIVALAFTLFLAFGNSGCTPSSSSSGGGGGSNNPAPNPPPVEPLAPGGNASANQYSTTRPIPTSLAADGSTLSNVTVTVTNADGDPLSDIVVTLNSNRGSQDSISAPSPAATNSLGQSSFTIQSSTPGEAILTASYVLQGKTVTQETPILFLPASPDSDFQARLFNSFVSGDNSLAMNSEWKDLVTILTTSRYGVLNSFSFTDSNGWTGAGTVVNPFALAFDGAVNGSSVEFNTSSGLHSNFSFEAWLKPASVISADQTILSNGSSQYLGTAIETNTGLTLKQSPLFPGHLVLQLGTAKTYSEEILADSPIGYWKLDETSAAASVRDSSGNGNDGVYGASAQLQQMGAVADSGFGIQSGASAVSGLSLNAGTTHTCEAWVNLGNTTGAAVDGLVITGSNATNSYCLYLSNNTIYHSSYTGSFASVAFSFSPNTWYHIAVVRNGTSVEFFVDGSQVGATQTLSRNDASTFTNIGSYGNGNFPFLGSIDEVAIYPTALSQARILAHSIAGKKRMHCHSSQPWTDSAWKHVMGVFNSSGTPSLSMYFDGVKQCEVSLSGVAYAGSTVPLRMGSDAGPSNFWDGLVADFRTYASALNAAAVSTTFQATKPRFVGTP